MKNILYNKNILSIIGGIVFLVIFSIGYSVIDINWYAHRDDGVITMSVGKNWIDYGFFGVSVSGPIVEATSSPLQLFIYAFVYKFFNISYATFGFWQTQITTFIIGASFIRFFKSNPLFSILFTIVAAWVLTHFYHFFEWHASGMENALTHVTFLLTFYILFQAIRTKKLIIG